MTGYTNGSGKKPDDEPPKRTTNITSLEEVRKRASAEAKRQAKAARGPSSIKDILVGAVFIALALGMLWTWLAPLFRSAGVGR